MKKFVYIDETVSNSNTTQSVTLFGHFLNFILNYGNKDKHQLKKALIIYIKSILYEI